MSFLWQATLQPVLGSAKTLLLLEWFEKQNSNCPVKNYCFSRLITWPKYCGFWCKHIEIPFLFPSNDMVFQINIIVLCQVSAFPLLEALFGGGMPPRMVSKAFGKCLYFLGPQTKMLFFVLISMLDDWL